MARILGDYSDQGAPNTSQRAISYTVTTIKMRISYNMAMIACLVNLHSCIYRAYNEIRGCAIGYLYIVWED